MQMSQAFFMDAVSKHESFECFTRPGRIAKNFTSYLEKVIRWPYLEGN